MEIHLWSFPSLVPRASPHPSSGGCWEEGGGVLILHAENARLLSSVSWHLEMALGWALCLHPIVSQQPNKPHWEPNSSTASKKKRPPKAIFPSFTSETLCSLCGSAEHKRWLIISRQCLVSIPLPRRYCFHSGNGYVWTSSLQKNTLAEQFFFFFSVCFNYPNISSMTGSCALHPIGSPLQAGGCYPCAHLYWDAERRGKGLSEWTQQ